jgi:hypothetical protein
LILQRSSEPPALSYPRESIQSQMRDASTMHRDT